MPPYKQRVKIICANCGVEFERLESQIHSKNTYCSLKCRNEHQKVVMLGNKNPVWSRILHKCVICGKEFYVKKSLSEKGYGKTCSKECLRKHYSNVMSGENSPTWRGGDTKIFKCQRCGNEYNSKYNIKTGIPYVKHCCRECLRETLKLRTGKKSPVYVDPIERICVICGAKFEVKPFRIRKGGGIVCSKECLKLYQSKKMSGSGNHAWEGGITFTPYCEKFNEQFKERVREFWGRKCGNCGKSEIENGQKLSIHHVYYNKFTCCDDSEPSFVALCVSCHAKTNFNRDIWEDHFSNLIYERGGKSFYTYDEYVKLKVN